MRHKNPTLSAQTQVLDPAHPRERVGSLSGFQTHPYSLHLKLSESFSQEERLQLTDMTRLSLEEEIATMREVIQALTRTSKSVEAGEPLNKELCEVLNLLGLNCSRVAALMRVQLLLKGPQSEGLLEDLIDSLSDFVETMTVEQEQQND